MKSDKSTVLDEALALVNGDRRADYGTPTQSFKRIAALWEGFLGHKITPHDVAQMLVLLKVARSKAGINGPAGRPQHDSLVDAAGYIACAEMLNEDDV